MIIIHRNNGAPPGSCPFDRHVMRPGEPIPPDALWIDLIEPTPQEDRLVESYLGICVPTREEMSDIEPSELLYTEDGARYMTARVVHNIDVDPEVSGITFILRDKAMVTVRYAEPKAFQMFTHRIARPDGCAPTPEAILAGLFETIIDRAADVLQMTGAQLDKLPTPSSRAKADPSAAIPSSRTRCGARPARRPDLQDSRKPRLGGARAAVPFGQLPHEPACRSNSARR